SSDGASLSPSDRAFPHRSTADQSGKLLIQHELTGQSQIPLLQCLPMGQPVIVPRGEHQISRKQIDPDALKVLYRLHQYNSVAYLVGGSVRDLLLGRRPKDFDIGTSAHPYQVKKLFRNCWIIGRRFRLAHVRFGSKVIEVATFRRQVEPGEEIVAEGVPAPVPAESEPRPRAHEGGDA